MIRHRESIARPRSRSFHLLKPALFAVVAAIGTGALATPASADLRVCNSTTSRVGLSLGYRNQESWVTEGWWNLEPNSCQTLLSGALVARYYYVYAIDYDHGGEWSGEAFMCTQDEMFTIHGIEDCEGRGYIRTGFFEVDTREQTNWTVQLTDPSVATGGP